VNYHAFFHCNRLPDDFFFPVLGGLPIKNYQPALIGKQAIHIDQDLISTSGQTVLVVFDFKLNYVITDIVPDGNVIPAQSFGVFLNDRGSPADRPLEEVKLALA
jgi:hypothetical protein